MRTPPDLENRGFITQIAPGVGTALEIVGREEFDLYLCDLGLPDGTGIDLIRKVRETRTTPAIALTGFGMQEDVDRAQTAGFDAHLIKPVISRNWKQPCGDCSRPGRKCAKSWR